MNYTNNLIVPFTYLVTANLTTGISVQTTLTMAADSAFELLCVLGSSTNNTTAMTIPNAFSVQITDQSTGRILSSSRVPQVLMTGVATNGWGMVEKYPIRFPASCILIFDILDLVAATHTVTIALKGYKLFAQT